MEQEKKKIVFQKLTPVDDIDMSIYEDAIEALEKNGYLKNFIADEAKGIYKYARGRRIS